MNGQSEKDIHACSKCGKVTTFSGACDYPKPVTPEGPEVGFVILTKGGEAFNSKSHIGEVKWTDGSPSSRIHFPAGIFVSTPPASPSAEVKDDELVG